MTFFKSMAIAISMYSKVPMPQFPWEKKEMKWAICFFPMVGLIIAIALSLYLKVAMLTPLPVFSLLMIACVIPVIVDGGIHIDGFMDTQDAISSYKTREQRLEILKDPHTGAFAIISLAVFGVLYIAFVMALPSEFYHLWALGFILARMLSGMSVIMFKNARGSGSLMAFQEETDQRKAEAVFYVQIAVFIVIILLNGLIRGVPALIAGVVMVWASALIFWLYYYRSKKIFGGITGDLAGWFLCLCELGQVASLALVSLFI